MNYTNLYPSYSFTFHLNANSTINTIYSCWLHTIRDAKFNPKKKHFFKYEVIQPAIEIHAFNMAYKKYYTPLVRMIEESDTIYSLPTGISFRKNLKEFCMKSYIDIKDDVFKTFIFPMTTFTFILYEDYLKAYIEGGELYKKLDLEYSFQSAWEATDKIIDGYNKLIGTS